MFRLFQTIFDATSGEAGPYPDWLIDKAIERAIDGLDPRIRIIGNYKKRLRESIVHAIDHVVHLVDGLEPAIEASRSQYTANPYLSTFFPSANELQQFFSNDRGLRTYLDSLNGHMPEYVTGLLMMERTESRVLGIEINGDILRRDVPQDTVSFHRRRLIETYGEEEETRRFLKRRGFDHLITLALHDVIGHKQQRQELEQQYTVLNRKLKTFQSAGCSFDVVNQGDVTDHTSLEHDLNEIERQLNSFPARTETLNTSLDTLIDVFSNASQKLWSVPVSLIVDSMNIKREKTSNHAVELLLNEFHSANGQIQTCIIVSYSIDEILPKKMYLNGLENYL